MWILFSLLCMVTLVAANIIGKKNVDSDELSPIKLRITVMTFSVVVGIVMYVLHLGESGLAPWELMIEHPILIVAVCCMVFSEFLYIFSLKYIGMTIMETVSSLESIVIFLGLILINLISGMLSAVKYMLIPARLIFILLILISTILLPNINLLVNRETKEDTKQKKHNIFGILIALLAAILGCGDSLTTDALLDSNAIGVIDISMTAYFSQILLLPAFCFALFKKSKSKGSTCKIMDKYSVIYAVLFVVYNFLGVIAISYDAVRSEVMFLVYPVIAVFGARLVLKEKYTWMQNICIWIIILSAIAFCVIDYII